MTRKSIGVLGGTFDPIHEGHLYLARSALTVLGLTEVVLMVAQPPHKQEREMSHEFHRYAMAALASWQEPQIRASAWELLRPGPSYTIRTLESWQRRRPQDRLCFIAGSDALEEIHLWRDCGKLLSLFSFFFVQRPGAVLAPESLSLPDELKSTIRVIQPDERPEIRPGQSFLVQLASPDVSASRVRRQLAAGEKPESGHLPEIVYTYITKQRLYERHQKKPGTSI